MSDAMRDMAKDVRKEVSVAIDKAATTYAEPIDELATGLGWLGVALGTAELVAPGALSRLFGLGRRSTLLGVFGIREIATGAAILANRPPHSGWLWARFAGDLIDLASLASGLSARPRLRRNAKVAMWSVAGIALVDFVVASALSAREQAREQGRR